MSILSKKIDELTEERENLLKAVTNLNTTTKARETRLTNAKAKLEAPKNLQNLTVTWTQEDVEMQIGPLKEASPVEFLKAVDALPRSIKAKLDGGATQKVEQLRGDLNRLPRTYKERRRALETRIYHIDEALAKLRSAI